MIDTISSGALLEHLQQEHRRLNAQLLDIAHRLADWIKGAMPQAIPGDVLRQLRSLRSKLASHFEAEETGGWLNEASVGSPSSWPQRQQIEAEHVELLRMFDQWLAASQNASPDTARLASAFEAFAHQLRDHEAAESRLLQYVLGGEAAEYDVEGDE